MNKKLQSLSRSIPVDLWAAVHWFVADSPWPAASRLMIAAAYVIGALTSSYRLGSDWPAPLLLFAVLMLIWAYMQPIEDDWTFSDFFKDILAPDRALWRPNTQANLVEILRVTLFRHAFMLIGAFAFLCYSPMDLFWMLPLPLVASTYQYLAQHRDDPVGAVDQPTTEA